MSKIDILEERCNLQERIILELYEDLEYFEGVKQINNISEAKGQAKYIKEKALNMRRKLKKYLKPCN